MLKRKITTSLLTWKQDPDKRVLLVKGARQVGKTYSILDFAKNNYQSTIYINFEENPAYKEIFAGDLDMTTLIKQITLRVPNIKMVPGQTLLFLDEIQSCPRARTALKFLALGRQFDVIASGPLLGINYKDVHLSLWATLIIWKCPAWTWKNLCGLIIFLRVPSWT